MKKRKAAVLAAAAFAMTAAFFFKRHPEGRSGRQCCSDVRSRT